MKTKIEYSVELQDVPKSLRIKFDDLIEKLTSLSHYLEAVKEDLEQDSISIITNRIDRCRRKLLQVDTGLVECDQALRSYGDTIRELQQHQAAAQAQAAQTQAPPTPVEGDNE